MDHVEGEVQAPYATPERIISIVSALASASVSANRTLPVELVRRLEEAAQQQGGLVPLHGRLFAQFMHFAYPRECSYPHATGTTQLMSLEEWSSATGKTATLQSLELQHYVEQQACDEDSGSCMAMWHDREELVDAGHWEIARRKEQESAVSSTGAVVLRVFMLLAFAAS